MEPGLAPFESSIAERYHEETKYSEASIRRDSTLPRPDWARQPSPFKRIDGARIVLPTEGIPIVRRGGAPDEPFARAPAGHLDLFRLSRMLWHTNGCTRLVRIGGTIQHFRAAPSAGAMYPTEIYVAIRDVPGIEPGIYDYVVLEHALALVARQAVHDLADDPVEEDAAGGTGLSNETMYASRCRGAVPGRSGEDSGCRVWGEVERPVQGEVKQLQDVSDNLIKHGTTSQTLFNASPFFL